MNQNQRAELEDMIALGLPPALIAYQLKTSLAAIQWRLPHARQPNHPFSYVSRQARVARIKANIAASPGKSICYGGADA